MRRIDRIRIFRASLLVCLIYASCESDKPPFELSLGYGAFVDTSGDDKFIIASINYGCCDLDDCQCYGSLLFQVTPSGSVVTFKDLLIYSSTSPIELKASNNGKGILLSDRCSLFNGDGGSWGTSCELDSLQSNQDWISLDTCAIADTGDHLVVGYVPNNLTSESLVVQRYSWDGASLERHHQDFLGRGRAGPIALNNSGLSILSWTEQFTEDGAVHLFIRVFLNGIPLAPQLHLNGDVPQSTSVRILALALDDSGEATIVWSSGASSQAESSIWVRHLDAEGFSTKRSIPIRGVKADASAYISRAGDIAFAWIQPVEENEGSNRSRKDVFYQRFSKQGEALIKPCPSGARGPIAYAPSVALTNNGSAVVVWVETAEQIDVGNPIFRVMAQRFGSDGALVGFK